MVLGQLLPIGSVIHSFLTEAQFQIEAGSGWVLADGRTANDTRYKAITGAANIPDLRGVFLRAKNNGSTRNPDGDLAIGTYSGDKVGSHSHGIPFSNTSSSAGRPLISGGSAANGSTDAAGSNETAPKSITVNIFIRVN